MNCKSRQLHYKSSAKILNVNFAQLYYYMQLWRAVSMCRILAKMRDCIPHYFAKKMKSNTAAVIGGLIIELLRSKDNDAF